MEQNKVSSNDTGSGWCRLSQGVSMWVPWDEFRLGKYRFALRRETADPVSWTLRSRYWNSGRESITPSAVTPQLVTEGALFWAQLCRFWVGTSSPGQWYNLHLQALYSQPSSGADRLHGISPPVLQIRRLSLSVEVCIVRCVYARTESSWPIQDFLPRTYLLRRPQANHGG